MVKKLIQKILLAAEKRQRTLCFASPAFFGVAVWSGTMKARNLVFLPIDEVKNKEEMNRLYKLIKQRSQN